jgi:hypothetical protein
MKITNPLNLPADSSWLVAHLFLAIILIILYGWLVFDPYAGDALMHMMDDTQIHSFGDALRTLYSGHNQAYQELHRLTFFHRPIFNELYLPALKEIFGVGSAWMRVMTLATLIGVASVFLSLMRKMHISVLPATIGAAWLVFSPSLFFGLYDYGLAFSQLLVLLAILSLWSLKKYIDCRQQPISIVWIVATLFFVFLEVFTKESALVWPMICLIMAVYFANDTQFVSNTKPLPITHLLKSLASSFFAFRWLAFALVAIIFLYLATRYFKLGSLTAIAGGIEQSPSLVDALIKFGGYTLLTLQIPSSVIPAYLTQGLPNMNWLEIALRIFVLVTALWALWAGWRKSRIATFALLACFILAFLPITKVSRNSPYYADLMAIPLAISLALGFEAIREKVSRSTYAMIVASVITSLFVVSAFFAGRYVYNTDMWLARSQGFVRSALADFSSAEGATEAEQIVGASGMFSPEQNWALGSTYFFGAAFIANLGIPSGRFVLNSEKLYKNDKVMFIDFYPEMNPRKAGVYPLPGYGRLFTAYFPAGFIRKSLVSNEGLYNIKGYKVIQLACDNPFQKSFDVGFKSLPDKEILRRIDSAMNINSTLDSLVLEFVAPPNAVSFRLLEDGDTGCRSPKVSGYSPLDPSSLPYTSTINASPRFENTSDWSGKLTRNPKGAGVIVGPGSDNPNVLSQRIPVRPFEPLKIVARASSTEKPSSTGRLQINWVDKNDKFLSSAGKTIELTEAETKHDVYMSAPAGAVAGILYVTPHAPQDIVRYIEMSLMRVNHE